MPGDDYTRDPNDLDRQVLSFGGSSFFGYEKIVRQRDRITLEGDDVPPLYVGMQVELEGNSRGYVPGGFAPGDKVEISDFRFPFEDGASDHIIRVSNKENDGWVKPSNIVKQRQPPRDDDADFLAADAANYARPPDAAAPEPEHLELLKQGAKCWNLWRERNPNIIPRLSGQDLRGIDLREVNLSRADLSSIEGYGIDLYRANLQSANLRRAFLQSASLHQANLAGADLSDASLSSGNLMGARLQKATLRGTTCLNCDFHSANLNRADLTAANLNYAHLFDANLSGATLIDTFLMATLLIRVNLKQAELRGCNVHGAAVWKIQMDANTTQTSLIVSDLNDPTLITDNLEIAQLIHLLTNASAIGKVINSMTGRAVLLLGRFTKERMEVLTAISDHLRQLGDLPIIFNFDKPVDRSVTETVRILAGLSKFIIADLTDPKSSPYESHITVPDMAVPFLPIILSGQKEFSMFEDLYDYPWLLDGFEYRNKDHLIENLDALRAEAQVKREDIQLRRNKRKAASFRTELPGLRAG
jgi:uncharacterized protein YjbI with pentapeptide repeats